jgi:pimeloyl-ACP methyl ester carboxylesterase
MPGFVAPTVHRVSAWDGPALRVLEWAGDDGTGAQPLLCLPGIVRTAGDFSVLAAEVGAGRRVVAIDYAGRGGSFRLPAGASPARYGPEACLRDVMDVAAALHLHRAVVIGTSFGGLLAMGLGAARPGLLAGVVLNDIGPEVGTAGAGFVRRFVADDPALPDLDACAAYLRGILPPMSLADDAAWQAMAALTYAPGDDGRWHPLWDTRIAALLDAPTPDLWPLFGALAPVPLLLVHGTASDILTAGTVARMQAVRQEQGTTMTLVDVPGIGHAPTLAEPGVTAALAGFLAGLDAAEPL